MNQAPSANRCAEGSLTEEEVNSGRSTSLDIWGDDININENKESLRIITVNINGLPKNTHHPKYGMLREAISTTKSDIVGLSEINIKWDRLYPTNRLKQRVSRWWKILRIVRSHIQL